MPNTEELARGERMSSVDTAWLRMDRATNRMAIVGVLIFDTPLDYARLRTTLEGRLLTYDRLRRYPVEGSLGAWWAETPHFDIAKHLRRTRLPGAGDAAALQRFVGKLVAQPFDPRRPWWEFHLVERYGSGSALVARIHHSYADGIALIGVMLSLTDDSPAARSPARRSNGDTPRPSEAASLWDGAIRLSGALLEKYAEVVRQPAKLIDYAKVAANAATELAQLATMADDSRTRFKGKAGAAKVVAWSEPLPLDEVKAVGRALGCSVNDVLLASVAGALRRYLVSKHDAVDGVELRAMVPVNLRPPNGDGKLGNRFGLVTLLLPLGLANPLARLYEIHRRMEALKTSYQPLIAFALLGVAGFLPRVLQQEMLDLLANKATAVMTNVPGPQKPLYLAGARLASLMFWVPQSGDIGMGVSILSYNGAVQFGLITDAGMVPDPEQVIAHFQPEFERLLLTVLMEPWDEPREPDVVERELVAAIETPRGSDTPGLAPPAGEV